MFWTRGVESTTWFEFLPNLSDPPILFTSQVSTVRPSLFLEAAYASNDPQHLAAVLRFFRDFIPGFATTSEHGTYLRALADMAPSITA